ncbi:LytTR family transcriptional regulator DNA-binding domain-containing protein [Alkalicoccus daliensis]|uniref:Transcriptional regulator, LytTR family n=1 Tax=Alkalicoccus daliensis TaxID=745820 RepID=A0A1H0KFC8_9BACI|nr:LytTR family transcriptional regulator DNA-binding domain-containing protein [Alkalicoccus daliensis]SDO54471.1 transcriptional regulator, LytTR family [Alkalicoccus daliensis]
MSLRFEHVEKHHQNTVVIPSLSLTIPKGEVAALHTSIDAKAHLLQLLGKKDVSGSGDIYIEETLLHKTKEKYHPSLGISLLEEGCYERMTVKENLTFLKRLFQSTKTQKEAAVLMHLEEKLHTKIQQLSYSEKRRVLMTKLLFQDPAVIVLEEPDQNMDIESKRILRLALEEWKNQEKSILLLTSNMESAITLADQVYRLTNTGLHKVETEEPETEAETDVEEEPFRFSKIPTKVEDKMVLFDPPEIDYIESREGKSYVFIENESFPCAFTLNELENKLKSFGFFRCHRSYIVNLQKVREVITWTRNSYSLQLDDKKKSEIPLSKGKMEDLKEMLGLK